MLRVKEQQLARLIRCPKCQHVFEPVEVQASSQHSVESNPAAVSVDTVANARLETREDADKQSSVERSEHPLRKLGRFELKRVLGQGGFGRVYLAFDPQLERDVALKVLATAVNSQVRIQRFLTEAKAAARLKHPNIVPTFESGREDNRYYIASEFIEGKLLSDEGVRNSLDERTAVECIRKLATALAYAHENNVVHRDVKPQNIIVDTSGEPHLMDFGLARRTDEESSLTTDGAMLGTPAYMSPEQARGEFQKVGPASDQYSLAVVMYELLTGQTPFDGLPHLVVIQVAKGDVPPVQSLRPNISEDLAAICEKAMQKLPGDRYLSCLAFAEDLAALLDGKPVAARPLNSLQKAVRFVALHRVIAAMTTVTLGLFLVLVLSVWHALDVSGIAVSPKPVDPQVVVAKGSSPGESLTRIPAAQESKESSSDTEADRETANQTATIPATDIGFAALLGESDEWEWGAPELATWIENDGYTSKLPTISMDGLTLAVASEKPGGSGATDIWITRRKHISDTWNGLTNPAFEINSSACDSFPSLSADGRSLYFHTHRPAEAEGDIWLAEWDSEQSRWNDVQPLPDSINTSGDEREPVISPDGLELIVWSDGQQSRQGGELWQYQRRDPSEPFGEGFSLRDANPALTALNLDYVLFYSPDSLMAVFAIHSEPATFVVCRRDSVNSPWEDPRAIRTLPSDSHGVTYSPAARLMFVYRTESERIWQMQLISKKDSGSPPSETGTGLSSSMAEVAGTANASSTLASTEIDLLSLIDPSECAIVGTWSRVADGIQSPKLHGSRLQIPWAPQGEYDLTIVAKPLDDVHGLTIGLVSDGHPFHALLNWGNNYAALENVDGLDVGSRPGPGRNSSSVYRQNVMTINRQSTIHCRVRKSGVSVDVDGDPLIDWKGQPDQLSRNGYWITPVEQALFVGSHVCRYEFSKITLTPVNGSVKQLPPPRLNSPGSLQVASSVFNVPLELLDDASKAWNLSVHDGIDNELAIGFSPNRSRPIQSEDIQLVTNLTCPVHLNLSALASESWSGDAAQSLADMPKLKLLKIDDNGAMPATLPAILSRNNSLRHLTLGHQKLEESQAREIGKISSLRELGFNFTDMNDASVRIIAEALPELELFHIGYTGANSRLTNTAVKSLSQLANLRDLSIRQNPTINDQCVEDLLKLKKLSVLWIDGTAISKSGYDRLKSQLPDAAITWTPLNAQ
jgi:serine/threonine protein kinase